MSVKCLYYIIVIISPQSLLSAICKQIRYETKCAYYIVVIGECPSNNKWSLLYFNCNNNNNNLISKMLMCNPAPKLSYWSAIYSSSEVLIKYINVLLIYQGWRLKNRKEFYFNLKIYIHLIFKTINSTSPLVTKLPVHFGRVPWDYISPLAATSSASPRRTLASPRQRPYGPSIPFHHPYTWLSTRIFTQRALTLSEEAAQVLSSFSCP